MSKRFNHKSVTIPKLKQINSDEGRRYLIEGTETKYPSITTVLSATGDKTALFEWRKRVGEEQANKVSAMATRRGTSMHKLCEQYLSNEKVEDDNIDGNFLFNGIRPVLDRINNVRCLETPLYSHTFRVAGTVDCIAELDNTLSIIDFKTANRPKKREWIEDYFIQGCFYWAAYSEIAGEIPKRVAILVSVQDGTTQEFILSGPDIRKYTEKLKKRIEFYYNDINTYTPAY